MSLLIITKHDYCILNYQFILEVTKKLSKILLDNYTKQTPNVENSAFRFVL